MRVIVQSDVMHYYISLASLTHYSRGKRIGSYAINFRPSASFVLAANGTSILLLLTVLYGTVLYYYFLLHTCVHTVVAALSIDPSRRRGGDSGGQTRLIMIMIVIIIIINVSNAFLRVARIANLPLWIFRAYLCSCSRYSGPSRKSALTCRENVRGWWWWWLLLLLSCPPTTT